MGQKITYMAVHVRSITMQSQTQGYVCIYGHAYATYSHVHVCTLSTVVFIIHYNDQQKRVVSPPSMPYNKFYLRKLTVMVALYRKVSKEQNAGIVGANLSKICLAHKLG